jgi:stage V sporulation protein G
MKITEVRIKLMEDSDDRLRAFCSVTFDDCFVVRDLKIIDGVNGPFVAMPSRKLTSHCPQCRTKNHLRATYCNQCGRKLEEERTIRDQDGRVKLYADIAHPINAQCREMIQDRVVAEYEKEEERATRPGYKSRYDEGYGEDDFDECDVSDRRAEQESTTRATTHIEPAESTPPAPHQKTTDQPVSPPQEHRESDKFGAGIFEE